MCFESSTCIGMKKTYISLELSDVHLVHDLTGLIRMSNILEGLGGILTGLIDQNLLSTGMLRKKEKDNRIFFEKGE